MQISAEELGLLLGGDVVGNKNAVAYRISTIEEADNRSLSFIANPKYYSYAEATKASIVIVPDELSTDPPSGAAFIAVKDPYSSFARLLRTYNAQKINKSGIESMSMVDPSASLGKDVYIGSYSYIGKNVVIGDRTKVFPHTYIGDNCTIGEGVVIYPGVQIYDGTVMGNDCIIHSGVVIGSHGFGFAPSENGVFEKVPQIGTVTIGNEVEIGANTVIDRATLGETKLDSGVKIDNLVQIAHNVEIGAHSAIAAQAGVSGSTKLGKGVIVGGQAGFVGHITIADGVKVNAQSGVSKNVDEKGSAISGSPADSFRKHYKQLALMRKLPELLDRIEALEKRLNNQS